MLPGTRASVCVSVLFFSGCLSVRAVSPPPSSSPSPELVEYAEAVAPSDLGRAKDAIVTQESIRHDLKDQLDGLASLKDSLDSLKGPGADGSSSSDDAYQLRPDGNSPEDSVLAYEVSALDLLEAPVIYLTPPLVLPDDQLEADKEIEDLLVSTGLESKPVDVSNAKPDPYHITSLEKARTALKSCQNEIRLLREQRAKLLKSLRAVSLQMSTDRGKIREFKSLKQEIGDLDRRLDDETYRLIKLQHVKEALVKSHGLGSDIEGEENELEDREDELVAAADEADSRLSHEEHFSDL